MTFDQAQTLTEMLHNGGRSELGEGPPTPYTRDLVADGFVSIEPQPDDGSGRALWRGVVTARGIREHRRTSY